MDVSRRVPTESVEAPDISRVLPSEGSHAPSLANTEPGRDVETWRAADMDRLIAGWNDTKLNLFTPTTLGSFRRAVHDIHGASGLYGGEHLTRLTATLQAVSRDPAVLRENTPLIDLLIQACVQAHSADEVDAYMVSQVCDALDAKFANRSEAA
ncbi:MAG: hypothetical protein AAGJ84_01655 [Pseudomonadota bacterium]